MVFNSLEFGVFFAVVLAVYWRLSHRQQNWFLLVASYVFYGAWDYRFLGLLLISTAVDYFVAIGIANEAHEQRRKRLLVASIAVNLGILGTFKYFDFFATSLADLAAGFGLSLSPVTLNIILPVGISFYTFQSMSYTIDVYRRKLEPTRSLPEFALYVAFFPQLVAGPIERAKNLLPQIQRAREVTAGKIGAGFYLVLLGLFKKVVVADNLAGPVDTIFSDPNVTGDLVVLGAAYFAFQIYCDFSGYSDIARGLARILGFELVVNFRQPFFATTPADLLRRWHISLSLWIRDYVFQPLGGMKRNPWLTIRNVTVTMLLAGLWHGAAWNFVLWGLYLAVTMIGVQIYQRFVPPLLDKALAGVPGAAAVRAVAWRTIFIIGMLYGFVIFRSTSFAQIWEMTAALGTWGSLSTFVSLGAKFLVLCAPIIILDWYEYRTDQLESVTRAPLLVQTATYAGAILLFLTIGEYDAQSFIYFQF